jgi:ABC-type nitrate/sulfonate/bicarbonate transport system substrate-binding protein
MLHLRPGFNDREVKHPMKRGIARVSLVGLLLAALTMTAATAAFARSERSAGPAVSSATPTVNLIEAGDVDFSSADVAYFAQLMKKNGINVNFQLISNAATALRTVIAGQADLFIGSLPTAILAVVNGGANIKVIAANDQASDYVLVAQKGVTLQNLAGKTLAIDTPGSAGHLIAKIGLQKAGADPDAPRYVTIGGSSARLTAILSGRVDIAPIHYPLALTALENPNISILVDAGKSIGPYLQSGLIANTTFLKDKALTQKAVNAFINAQRWAASNKFKYIDFANSNKMDGGLNPGQESKVWDYYRSVGFWGINGGICFDHVTQFAKLNWTIGSLPKPLPDRKDWLDDSFVKTYLKAHKQKPGTC